MTREEALWHLDTYSSTLGSGQTTQDQHEEAKRIAIEALENAEQIRWERDTAIQQLAELGYGLGEKPRTDGDCISRQAAIEALVKAIREDPYYDSNEAINGLGVYDVRVILNDLPSVQPEKRTEERTKMHACDLISRQAAIDAVTDVLKRIPTNAIRAKGVLEALPSAQPEKKGKWKLISDGFVDFYECNQCGEPEEFKRNYCPNCGSYNGGDEE